MASPPPAGSNSSGTGSSRGSSIGSGCSHAKSGRLTKPGAPRWSSTYAASTAQSPLPCHSRHTQTKPPLCCSCRLSKLSPPQQPPSPPPLLAPSSPCRPWLRRCPRTCLPSASFPMPASCTTCTAPSWRRPSPSLASTSSSSSSLQPSRQASTVSCWGRVGGVGKPGSALYPLQGRLLLGLPAGRPAGVCLLPPLPPPRPLTPPTLLLPAAPRSQACLRHRAGQRGLAARHCRVAAHRHQPLHRAGPAGRHPQGRGSQRGQGRGSRQRRRCGGRGAACQCHPTTQINAGCVPVAPCAGASVTHFHCRAAEAPCRLVQASNFEKQSNQSVKANNELVKVCVHVGSVRWSSHSVKSKCSWAGAACRGCCGAWSPAAPLASCCQRQSGEHPACMPTSSASCLCP